jgi:Dolichyl-phosphate-mannose-protein mannosyltransferase
MWHSIVAFTAQFHQGHRRGFSKMQRATGTKNSMKFLIAVCVFAFLLRIIVMFATRSYQLIDDSDDHFAFGWEMGRVAYSLAEGHGFSSPLPMQTGPTAMVGPIYPLLLALIFKIFGLYSTGSAIAIRVVQSVFSSVTCIFIFLCGRDTAGERTGRLAACLWALFPLNIFFTVARVWETSLTSLLMVVMFWSMFSLRDSVSIRRWSANGALLGFAALVSTSLVTVAIPFGMVAIWRNRLRAVLPATVGLLTCCAVLSPWLVRNYLQFGRFMLRSNFPLEFRVANNELSYGQKVESLHPSNTPSVNKHWQDVGEMRFMQEEQGENKRFVSDHFGSFAFGTANRIVNYWTGAWIKPMPEDPNLWSIVIPTSLLTLFGLVGLYHMFRYDRAAALMYAGCIFVYPLVYYSTTSQPRFYHPITPLLILSGSFWLVACADKKVLPDLKRALFDRERGATEGVRR